MRCHHIPLIALLVTAGCSTEPAVTTGECVDALSDEAWVDRAPPRFVELWRAGGTREGEELSMPLFAASSPDHRLAITDLALLQVIGVGPDGEWLGQLTTQGSGPGEVSMPTSAAWTEKGRLTVFDVDVGKIVFLDPAEPVPAGLIGEARLDPLTFATIVRSGQVGGVGLAPDGTTYVQPNAPDAETGSVAQAILRVSPDTGTDTLATSTVPSLGGEWAPAQGMAAPGFPRLIFAVGADGRVAVGGEGSDYRVRIIGPAGGEQVICRPVTGLPLRPDEKGEGLEPDNPFRQPMLESPRPAEPAPIGRLMLGREGRLWVERDRPSMSDPRQFLSGRPGSLYDVFDAEGAYLGELRAPDHAKLIAASGDRVWAFEVGEFDVTWVVAYRLETAPGRG